MRPNGSAAELESRRRRGLELLAQGYSVTSVGRILGCGHSAVSKWRKAYEARGEEGVQAVPHPGGISRLSDDDLLKLAEYLKQGPTAVGFETELWTCRRVAHLIEQRFGIEYHHCHVWKILRKLGWTCQKPERRAREQNQDAVLEWRETRWAELKKSQAA